MCFLDDRALVGDSPSLYILSSMDEAEDVDDGALVDDNPFMVETDDISQFPNPS